MKRIFLFGALLIGALASSAQVAVLVLQPSSLEGSVDFTWASDWGMTPDLNLSVNNVTAFTAFVDDGTAADSLGCNALVNGADIAGKIAVVYRGTCEFGMKSLNAQNAGAVAVVIINNAPGAPVGMGGGAVGSQISIPVVMISQADGANLRSEILAGNVEMFIGSQTNFFAYNLGFNKSDVLIPGMASTNSLIASNDTEFSVALSAMIRNYGNQAQNTARVQAVVTQNGSTVVYDQTSPGAVLPSGDSIFVSLPLFSQPSYSGYYTITYTLLGDVDDEFPGNNTYSATLNIGDVLGYAPANTTTGLPAPSMHAVPSANVAGFKSCVAFTNPNAGRLAATGLWFNASAAVGTPLTDELVTITGYVWSDVLTTVNQLPTDAGLSAITTGEYVFTSDEREVPIYIPFFDVLEMVNDQQYLFCIDSYSGVVRHGWDNSLDYDRTQLEVGLPISYLKDGTTWYNGFTGITGAPAIGIAVVDVNTIGIEENLKVDVTPYPNPANQFIRIPLKGMSGTAMLRVFNTNGAQVLEQRTGISNDGLLTVDVSSMANGTYLFKMDLADGKHSEFRVVVTK